MALNFFQKNSKHLLTGYQMTDVGSSPAPIVVAVDAVLSEGQDYSSEISSFPIEAGFNITDHIRREPETLSLKGFVTDHPINILGIGSEEPTTFNTYMSRSWQQYENLLRLSGYKSLRDESANRPNTFDFDLNNESYRIKIVSSYRIYTNMFMQNLHIDIDPKTGDALEFTASFKKVYFTTSQRTYAVVKDIPPASLTTTQAAPKSSGGVQGPLPLSPTLKSQITIGLDTLTK
jgi:hypothetical protein